MSVSKRIRIYTKEDVVSHQTSSNCWVVLKGKVYDVTGFLSDHPGGDEIILNHAGSDIENAMKDPSEHEHSDSAYEMLEEFVIGRIGTEAAIVSEGNCVDLYTTFRC